MTCFCAFKRGTPATLRLCSLPDPKDRLQECWDNWRFDQFATDNGFPVCRVQKMSDNEEPSNDRGFGLVTLRLFPRDIANCFSQGEKFRKAQKRKHWTQLRVFFKLFLFMALLHLNLLLPYSCVRRRGLCPSSSWLLSHLSPAPNIHSPINQGRAPLPNHLPLGPIA